MESPRNIKRPLAPYSPARQQGQRGFIDGRYQGSHESLLLSPEHRRELKGGDEYTRYGPKEYVKGFMQRLSTFIEFAPSQMQRTGQKTPLSFNVGEIFKRDHDLISCVVWRDGLYYVTGTDIVKVVRAIYAVLTDSSEPPSKKFEEGVFSDLRNFKTGDRARLEGPRSEMLQFLHKQRCVRTQKKQKVFYWLFWADYMKLFELANARDTKRVTIQTQYAMMTHAQRGMCQPIGFSNPNTKDAFSPRRATPEACPEDFSPRRKDVRKEEIEFLDTVRETETSTNVSPLFYKQKKETRPAEKPAFDFSDIFIDGDEKMFFSDRKSTEKEVGSKAFGDIFGPQDLFLGDFSKHK
ncbi:MAG: transcription factor Ste12-like protein [Amphiamblys sp. WSBS2006]|nr:MAG: transcription factor Ste12-like protein [Amphiamblys sp. WSBS2006]